MSLRVEEWTGSAEAWDAFVRASVDGTVMHLHAWKVVLEEAYRLRTIFLAARDHGILAGILPLTLVRSAFFGRSLVSMPFMDYGGVCSAGDRTVEQSLVDAGARLADRYRAKLVLRCHRETSLGLQCSLHKVTLWMDLGSSEGALWSRLPAERRNRVRKAQRSGLAVAFPGAEGVGAFYEVFGRNMRDLGSPVHSRRFFDSVLQRLPGSTRLIIVNDGSRPVGAGLMLLYDGVISIPWVSSLRSHFAMCPNQLLYWEAMRFGITNGFRILDFGRSSRNTGSFEAKRQWGAEPRQLHWYYHPEGATPPGDEVRRAAWAAALWKRLPLRIANRVGPLLRRGIAN